MGTRNGNIFVSRLSQVHCPWCLMSPCHLMMHFEQSNNMQRESVSHMIILSSQFTPRKILPNILCVNHKCHKQIMCIVIRLNASCDIGNIIQQKFSSAQQQRGQYGSIHLFVEFNLIIRVRAGAADLQNSCDNNSAEFRVLISQGAVHELCLGILACRFQIMSSTQRVQNCGSRCFLRKRKILKINLSSSQNQVQTQALKQAQNLHKS